jgi:glucokinase
VRARLAKGCAEGAMILVCDVGGTRTRIALAERDGGGFRLHAVEESPTAPGVPDAVRRYLARNGRGAVTAAAFGGAGAVAPDGSIRLTNAHVRLVPSELARAAGVGSAVVANDFGAIAEAIPHLPPAMLAPCGGERPVAGAPVVVLGPGTGLGTAIAAPGARGWLAMAGDGGHSDLAAVDDDELEIWQRLRRAHGRVSAETVLCGPGLERLHAAISGGPPLAVADIDAAAWRGEPHALRTHALFTRWLGRVAGNLALFAGARGGVYLAGGILPRWGARFDVAAFRRGFEDKAPFGPWLAAIPAFLITHPHPGLVGLAALAQARA